MEEKYPPIAEEDVDKYFTTHLEPFGMILERTKGMEVSEERKAEIIAFLERMEQERQEYLRQKKAGEE